MNIQACRAVPAAVAAQHASQLPQCWRDTAGPDAGLRALPPRW